MTHKIKNNVVEKVNQYPKRTPEETILWKEDVKRRKEEKRLWRESVQKKRQDKHDRREFKKTQEYRDYLTHKRRQTLVNRRYSKYQAKQAKSLEIAQEVMNNYQGVCKVADENPNFIIFDDSSIWNINKRKFLGTSKHVCGYLFTNAKFVVKGKKQQMLLHRIIAINLIPNPLNLPEVNHISFNKEDCSVKNLEWCDKNYNMGHYWDTYDKTAIKITNKKRFKGVKILQYTMDDKFIAEYSSIAEAAKKTGTSSQCLAHAANGKLKSSNGFKWKRKPDI